MEVKVKVFAYLRKKLGEKELTVKLTGPGTVNHLIKKLGIPETEKLIVLVNGISREKDHRLSNKDTVSIFPLIGGG